MYRLLILAGWEVVRFVAGLCVGLARRAVFPKRRVGFPKRRSLVRSLRGTQAAGRRGQAQDLSSLLCCFWSASHHSLTAQQLRSTTSVLMGGPCLLPGEDGRLVRGPQCTNNFHVRKFSVAGEGVFYSIEHAFQALKFCKGSQERKCVDAVVPDAEETGSSHGLRCWSAGAVRAPKGVFREDWDAVKVGRVSRAVVGQRSALSSWDWCSWRWCWC
jgi:hypothetical protein